MNKLCDKCSKACKQPEQAKILECKKFKMRPVQLQLKFKKPDK